MQQKAIVWQWTNLVVGKRHHGVRFFPHRQWFLFLSASPAAPDPVPQATFRRAPPPAVLPDGQVRGAAVFVHRRPTPPPPPQPILLSVLVHRGSRRGQSRLSRVRSKVRFVLKNCFPPPPPFLSAAVLQQVEIFTPKNSNATQYKKVHCEARTHHEIINTTRHQLILFILLLF